MRAPAKRTLDVVLSAGGLLLLAPVLAATALAVRLAIGSPVLFRQRRPGLHGRPFTLLKFRTMRDAVDAEGNPLPDDARMTRLGHFLRSTSLDELPELWNVLRGEMSLVGPRPLLMEYLPLYTPEQARRHEVRPGITGWAQVNGRNAISWEEKFRLDVWYVDHRSLRLDLKILLLTLKQVFRREGISQEGRATMERFRGTSYDGAKNDDGAIGGSGDRARNHDGAIGGSGDKASNDDAAGDAGAPHRPIAPSPHHPIGALPHRPIAPSPDQEVPELGRRT
jgi:lipopolysaccharide/colanic/teichoic acid biosynthesis glycosyltransferase